LGDAWHARAIIENNELYSSVGALIADARRKRKLSQADLAALAGRSRTSISNIEAGRQHIPIHTLFAFARALNVSPESLLPELVSTELDVSTLLKSGMSRHDIRTVFNDEEVVDV